MKVYISVNKKGEIPYSSLRISYHKNKNCYVFVRSIRNYKTLSDKEASELGYSKCRACFDKEELLQDECDKGKRYICEICGKEIRRFSMSGGKTVCPIHPGKKESLCARKARYISSKEDLEQLTSKYSPRKKILSEEEKLELDEKQYRQNIHCDISTNERQLNDHPYIFAKYMRGACI